MEVTIKTAQPNQPAQAPPAAAAPAQAAPPAALPTEADLRKMRSEVSEAMGWGKADESPPPLAPVATPAPAVSPSAAPASPPAQPAAAPAAPRRAAPDQSEVIRETATEVARAVTDALDARRETPAPEPSLELSPEDEEALLLARFLAESNPEKYRNLPDELLAYFQELYAYQDQWQEKNPGEKFDPEASEHAAWYDEHPQPIDLQTLEGARRDREIEARVKERVRPLEEKLTMIDQEKMLDQATGTIVSNLHKQQYNLVAAAAPELAKLLLDANGNVDLGQENLRRLEEADPIAKSILDEAARGLTPAIIELERVAVKGAGYKLDPRGNAIHALIDEARQRAEQEILDTPEAQDKGGRKFITLAQLGKKQDAIESSRSTRAQKDAQLAALKSKHWTLTIDELEELMVDETARAAKERIDYQDQLAQRKYRRNGGPAAEPARAAPQPAAQPAAQPAPQPAARARPQSFSSQSDTSTAPQRIGEGAKSAGEQAAEVHFK